MTIPYMFLSGSSTCWEWFRRRQRRLSKHSLGGPSLNGNSGKLRFSSGCTVWNSWWWLLGGRGTTQSTAQKTMDSTRCPKHLRSCHDSKNIIVLRKKRLKRPGQMEKEIDDQKTQEEMICSFHHHHLMSCSTFVFRCYDTCHPKAPLKAWLTLQTTSVLFLSLQKFIYFATIQATPIFCTEHFIINKI